MLYVWMRASSSHPASLQEAAGETGFPGHDIFFLMQCRQLDLSVCTHIALFCLKWPRTSAQGHPVLQAVTTPTGDSPVPTSQKEKLHPVLAEHTGTVCALTTAQWCKNFRPLCLWILSDITKLGQKHHHAKFFLSQSGKCNPGGISEDIIG